MRTHLFSFVCLSLLCAACSKETDFVSLAEPQLTSSLHALGAESINQGDLERSPCIELITTHLLQGSGIHQPVLEFALPETSTNRLRAKRYIIEASGEAVSKSFARGLSDLNLVYDSRIKRLTGSLITNFFYGETLELKVEGDAKVRFEGQTMKLQAKVISATFRTGAAVYELDYGQIELVLPRTMEGPVEIQISTSTQLCEI